MDATQKVKGVVDIVFLVDITGSMQHCIDALKTNIAAFIDTLTSNGPNNDNPVRHWRAKAVGFRDFLCDSEPLVDNPFVEEAGSLKNQLAGLKAKGGGDEPESLLDALYKVASMEQAPKGQQAFDPSRWRYRSEAARVVIIFTDASYHEKMSQPKGGTVDDVITMLHGNRIVTCIFAPEMECYDRLSAADKSEYMPIEWDRTKGTGAQDALAQFTADQKNFQRTLEALAKSVSTSAAVTLD